MTEQYEKPPQQSDYIALAAMIAMVVGIIIYVLKEALR